MRNFRSTLENISGTSSLIPSRISPKVLFRRLGTENR